MHGGWVIEDNYHFQGKKYTDSTMSFGQAKVDADGPFAHPFYIPADYGGVHDVISHSRWGDACSGGR